MANRIVALLTISVCIVLQGTIGQAGSPKSVFIKRTLPLKTHFSFDSSEESFLPQSYPMKPMKSASVRILDPSLLLPPESRRPTTKSPTSFVPSYEKSTISPLKRQVLYEAGTPEQEDQFPLRFAEENSGSIKHYDYNSNDNSYKPEISGSIKHYDYNSNDNSYKPKCPEKTSIGAAVVAPECKDLCNYELVEKRTFICRPKDTVVQLLKSKASSCDSMAAAASSSSNAGRIEVTEDAKNNVPMEIVEINRYFRH